MTTNRAYLVVPKLIEQPTWGGTYIMKTKGWETHPFAQHKVGQSYELYSDSNLSLLTDTDTKEFQPEIDSIPEQSFPIEQMRAEYPEGLLGTRGIAKFNGALKTLIKFTQAKGNSFQLHVKTPSNNWLPKPESWYYFEKGCATLGILDTFKIAAYKKACIEIEEHMNSLTAKIDTDKPESLKQALRMAQVFIKTRKIYSFVNIVTIPKNSVVDIHKGGIHHSWEEDENIIPNGNILYEVQVDVMDDVSTLRSFDKGKITNDGSVRSLQISEYFDHLDLSPEMNDPKKLIKKPVQREKTDNYSVSEIFNTDFYRMDEIVIVGECAGELTNTGHKTFHHLFVRNGDITYQDESISIHVSSGHSLIVPANVGRYTLVPNDKKSIILKTYV